MYDNRGNGIVFVEIVKNKTDSTRVLICLVDLEWQSITDAAKSQAVKTRARHKHLDRR